MLMTGNQFSGCQVGTAVREEAAESIFHDVGQPESFLRARTRNKNPPC
jgi:hypothetical protein